MVDYSNKYSVENYALLKDQKLNFNFKKLLESFKQVLVLTGTAEIQLSMGPIKRKYTISRGAFLKVPEGVEFTISNFNDEMLNFILVDFKI
jgi:mannose-6-phosphate isomerase-like protein (cupin superfamily)